MRSMKTKKSLVLLMVLCLGIFAGIARFLPQVKAQSQFESFTQFQSWTSVYWNGGNMYQVSEAFTPASNHTVTSVKLYLQKTGSPLGNMTVSLRLTSAHLPTGSDLISGQINASTLTTSGAWYQINMASTYALKANTEYAVVLNDSSDASGNCPQTGANYTAGYTNGLMGAYNYGWSLTVTKDIEFQIWGDADTLSASSVSVNQTTIQKPSLFQALFTDQFYNVSGFIFGQNMSGSWVNQTWTSFTNFSSSNSAWAQNTTTITASISSTVQWEFWANSTSNVWNNTGLQSFTVLSPYENNVASGSWNYVYGVHWDSQTFTVGSIAHSVTSIYMYLSKFGSPTGNLTVSIRATSSGLPTGLDLTGGQINSSTLSTSGAWYQISVPEYPLTANKQYAVVLYDPSDTTYNIPQDYPTGDTYSGGTQCYSSNSGSSWTSLSSYDLEFQISGNPVNASSYSTVTVSSRNYNTNANFITQWNNGFNVSGYIIGTNLTGSWINQTWTPFTNFYNSTSAWSQNNITISAPIGSLVQWEVWENNTANLWNNTGLKSFTVTNAILYEQNLPLPLSGYGDEPPYWEGQTFLTGSVSHSVTSVWLYMKVVGNPNGIVTVSIRATSLNVFGTYTPQGSDLTSGTVSDSALSSAWSWIQINVTEYQLQANTKYAIIIRDTKGTDYTNCSAIAYSLTNTYGSGMYILSTDSGATFYSGDLGYDVLFQIVGYSVPTISNFQTDQANTVLNVAFFLNCTVSDYRGTGYISSVSVEFSDMNQIIASWTFPNTFTISSGIAYLTSSGCTVTYLNSTTAVITWEITRTGTQAEDVVRVLSPQTLVTDTYGLTGTNSLDKLCSYSIPTPTGQTTPTNPTNPENPTPSPQPSPSPSQSSNSFPLPPEPSFVSTGNFNDWWASLSPLAQFLGICIITGLIAGVGLFVGIAQRPKTWKQAQQLWKTQINAQGRKVKWNKDETD